MNKEEYLNEILNKINRAINEITLFPDAERPHRDLFNAISKAKPYLEEVQTEGLFPKRTLCGNFGNKYKISETSNKFFTRTQAISNLEDIKKGIYIAITLAYVWPGELTSTKIYDCIRHEGEKTITLDMVLVHDKSF